MRPLRICLAASEVAPFAKTGGLADVLAGLGLSLLGELVALFGRLPTGRGSGITRSRTTTSTERPARRSR